MVSRLLLETIAYASSLGFLSMGLTLTYITTKVPNFAHADFAVSGMYVVLWLTKMFNKQITYNYFLYGFPLAFIVGALIAVGMYLIVLKPLANRGNSLTGLMIATFAVDLFLFASYTIYATIKRPEYGRVGLDTLPRYPLSYEPRINVFGEPIIATAIIGPIILIVIATIFWAFLKFTKFGTAMRASIENPSLAEVMGVNVNLIYLVSWVIAGGLAGMAGVILAYHVPVNPNASNLLIVSVFAGSIAGGLTSLFGGVVGGFLIGIFEQLGSKYTGDFLSWIFSSITHEQVVINLINYPKVFSLGIIIIVLLLLPQGIGGVDYGAWWRRIRGKEEKSLAMEGEEQ
ncbi:MAG: branched-chain amino acid ABC transporter permease [Desulfurococcales archaeon]|nr:branched-chain amino acid ABC transporter permease [Desulfurococcales archaeon]